MNIRDKIGDACDNANSWAARHPLVLDALCAVVLGCAVLQLFKAVEVVWDARREADAIQLAASEALGG